MKKYQKLLSVLLAGVMTMSTFSAAMVAFAEEAPEETTAEEAVQNPADNLISVYKQFASQNGLTEDQLATKKELEKLIASVSDAGRAFIMTLGADEATLAVQDKIAALIANTANLGNEKPKITVDPSDPKYAAQKAAVERYEAKLALYNEILPLYKALSEAQKDSLDITTALRFLGEVQKKEAFEIKSAYDSALPPGSKDAMQPYIANEKAIEKFDSLLGRHTARSEAIAIGKAAWEPLGFQASGFPISLTKTTDFKQYPAAVTILNNYVAEYKKASDLGRAYFDGIQVSNHGFGMSLIGGGLRTLVPIMVQKQISLGEVSFDMEKPPKAPQKPNYKNFPGGKQDPDYIAALEVYLTAKKLERDYEAAQKNWEGDLQDAALASLTSTIPSMKPIVDTILQLRKGFGEFVMTNDGEEAAKAVDMHDALGVYEQTIIKNYTLNGYAYPYMSSGKDDWYLKDLKLNKLYAECVNAKDIFLVNNFVEYIDSVDLNKVTNETIAKAMEEYNKIPSGLRVNIPAETMAKYEKILNLYIPVAPRTPSDYDFAKEIAEYNNNKASVTLPDNKYANAEGVKAAMAELDNILTSLIAGDTAESLPEMLETGVYTNGAMATVFNIFIELNKMDIPVDPVGNVAPIIAYELTPKKVATMLPEEEFAAAKAKLLATVAADGTSSVDDYANIHWDNGDWGFEDGDRAGFEYALAAILRPVMNILHNGILILSQLLCLPNYLENNGDYAYGAYDLLVPALESMGFNVPSSFDYTVNFNEQNAISKEKGLSALSAPLIHAIFDFVEELAAAPAETLVGYLPGIAYTIDTGLLDESVKAALNTSGILGGLAGSLDLSADGINAMLTAQPLSIALDKETTLEVELQPIDWNHLAHCGAAYRADSVRSTNLYRVGVVGNDVKTFASVYYYLYDVIFADNNYGEIKTALRSAMPLESLAIIPALGVLHAQGQINSLGTVLNVLAGDLSDFIPGGDENPDEPDTPDTPDTPDEPDDGDDKNNADDPDIPDTAARSAGTALASLAALAGLGAGITIFKRKRDEE